MKIEKILNLSGKSSAGMCEILIRVSHLDKTIDIPSGVTCHENDWDGHLGTITGDKPEVSLKNGEVDAQIRRLSGILQDMIDDFLTNNLTTIADKGKVSYKAHPGQNNHNEGVLFFDVLDAKIQSCKKLNTIRSYKVFRNRFERLFGDKITIPEIGHQFISDFHDRLSEHYGERSSTIHLMLAQMKAVINFGWEKGLLEQGFNFRIPHYVKSTRNRNLSNSKISQIFNTFKHMLKNDPQLKNPSSMALAIFILDIAFQGIAPVDLANIKIGDMNEILMTEADVSAMNQDSGKKKNMRPDSLKAISLRLHRKKTGRPVHIITAYSPVRDILTPLMSGKSPDDFLIPCYTKDKHYSESQRQNKLCNYFFKMSLLLNDYIGDSETGKITYYFARHAFCNMVDALDVPRHIIQLMIGHRSTVLENHYLRHVTPQEQFIISYKLLQPLMP